MEITTDAELQDFIKEGLCVVDYYAPWCKPCKLIAPIYHEQSGLYTNIKFASVDVDKVQAAKISTVPTFKFYDNGKTLEAKVIGMNAENLKSHIKRFSGGTLS